MDRRSLLAALAAGAAGVVTGLPGAARTQERKADDLKKRTEDAVEKGLEWLRKTQAPDGHWAAQGGQYPTSMTALAGMCLLMEGSTLKEGKYSDQIRKAVDWFLAGNRQQANGLLGDVRNPTESTRYMYGQGFGTMFLASVYGEEEDEEQRKKLEKTLKKAVEFICKGQTNKKHRKPEGKEVEIGGWGYVSAADGGNFDEGSVTITAMQGLRAARNAGIPVPKESIQKATDYLEACTTPKGGVIYSYAGGNGAALNGQERPPLTAAAVACSFSAGQYKGDLAKKWIKYCKDNIPVAKGRIAHDEYQNYYFAQFVYVLGEDRYGDLFPNEDKNNWMTWSKYREAMYPYILDQQDKNAGNWTGGYVGPVFATATNLTILQLEKGILPIYQR
ncbi:MAG TPA: prenyltransferase/squalene oxidase repeat-containing protein [Gemmata sp.]|nr:prenyltransferase/squalene oxidase repeat-containing protein [Gemmata sp.]